MQDAIANWRIVNSSWRLNNLTDQQRADDRNLAGGRDQIADCLKPET